jgi:hypothetical protein
MLEESKQKSDALTEAYSVLHNEFMKLRSAQSRSQHRHTGINIPFDLSTGMGGGGVNGGPVGGMPLLEGWQMFNDLPNYAL